MIGLDTNVLLRWLLDGSVLDTPEQVVAARRFIDHSAETLLVNHVVLAEVAWVLRNRAGLNRDAIVAVVERLLAASGILVHQPDIVATALAAYAEHRGDFADRLIGVINIGLGCSATLTFDKNAARSSHFVHLRS